MDDGTEGEIGPGQVASISPGHDAEVIGDEPCIMVDLAEDEGYGQARVVATPPGIERHRPAPAVAAHQGVAELLDGWQGTEVSVRIIVGDQNELIAVFSGRLEGRSDEKHPSLFWPLTEAPSPDAERPGVYLHPDAFEGGGLHPGGFVLEFRHGNVTTNVRRLGRPAAGQA
jgi:hypothetical protein